VKVRPINIITFHLKLCRHCRIFIVLDGGFFMDASNARICARLNLVDPGSAKPHRLLPVCLSFAIVR
jgi:hypothetical protein